MTGGKQKSFGGALDWLQAEGMVACGGKQAVEVFGRCRVLHAHGILMVL
jgi:hypothetical protein